MHDPPTECSEGFITTDYRLPNQKEKVPREVPHGGKRDECDTTKQGSSLWCSVSFTFGGEKFGTGVFYRVLVKSVYDDQLDSVLDPNTPSCIWDHKLPSLPFRKPRV